MSEPAIGTAGPPGRGRRPALPYVSAHRGARSQAPENTIAAFRAALEAGAAALELDVHLTRDERVVVIHDATLDRTTDASGPVSARSGEQVRALDAGSWFSAGMAGQHIPFLEDVIELTEGRARLHIELKGERGEALAERVVATVRRLGAADRVVIMSFDLDAALAARRSGPEISTLAIVGGRLEDQLGFVRSTGLAGLNQAPDRWARATIERFHEHGLLVHGSLVNDRHELEAFFASGGDMADSDAPECYARGRSARPGSESSSKGAAAFSSRPSQ
jgi:glycerophosphoryl diester phosphodiesterase